VAVSALVMRRLKNESAETMRLPSSFEIDTALALTVLIPALIVLIALWRAVLALAKSEPSSFEIETALADTVLA